MQIYTNEKTPGIRTKDGGVKAFPTFLLTVYVVAAAVFCTVSLLGGGITQSEYFKLLLSVAMPVLGIMVCAKLTASIKPLIPYCVITGLILFMGANLTVSSAIAVSLLLFAASAYLLRNKFWGLAILAAIASSAITYVLTKNVLLALTSTVFLPTAIALYLSFEKKMHRVNAVCAISVTLGISLTLLFLVWLYTKEGSISLSVLRNFFDTLREGLTTSISNALVQASAQLEATISATDALALTTSALALVFNLFPAIATILLFVISYVTHSLYVSIVAHTVDDNNEIMHAISFKMSVTSAILFLVAYFGALILDYEGLSLYATAAQNIYLMLFPGLSLITFGFIGHLSKSKGASCLTSFIYFAIFGLILFVPGIAASIAGGVISISAFVGAVLVIISAVKNRSNNKNNQNKK